MVLWKLDVSVDYPALDKQVGLDGFLGILGVVVRHRWLVRVYFRFARHLSVVKRM